MKKAMKRLGMHSLSVVVFLFGALLFSVGTVSAQAIGSDQYDWKATPEAMQILDGQIGQLAGEISGLTPGTPQYENVAGHLDYYKLVYGALEEGDSVAEAAIHNLGMANIAKTDDNPQAQATRNQLFSDLVQLLTN